MCDVREFESNYCTLDYTVLLHVKSGRLQRMGKQKYGGHSLPHYINLNYFSSFPPFIISFVLLLFCNWKQLFS
jgi:hypothetical protein